MSNDKSTETVKPKKEAPKPAAAKTPGQGPMRRMAKYLGEVQTELRKTTWPTKPELVAQTQVVFGVLILIGVFISAWDYILGIIFQGILTVMGVPVRR